MFEELTMISESRKYEIWCSNERDIDWFAERIREEVLANTISSKLTQEHSRHIKIEIKRAEEVSSYYEWQIKAIILRKGWEPYAVGTGGYWHTDHYKRSRN